MCYLYWLHLPEHTDILSEGYIGVTRNPTRRLTEHKRLSENRHLNYALEKYNNIKITLLLQADSNYCYLIEELLRPAKDIGWNINKGGKKPPVGNRKGQKHTIEANEKNRMAHLGRIPWNKGLTKEEDERVARYVIKGSQSKKGMFIGQNNPFYGRKHTEEAKEKNRLAHLGKPRKTKII